MNPRPARRRLARVRHHNVLPRINVELPPRDVAWYAAYARSCRPAWEAARFGDRDPQVLAMAAVFTAWMGEPWEQVRA